MILIRNTQRTLPINKVVLTRHAKAMLTVIDYKDFDLGIWFTTNETIRAYNKKYRNKDKATDILSFPYHPTLKAGARIIEHYPEDKNLGDLIISAAYVKNDAPRWGNTFEERLDILLAHGIAHLLGHDHEKEEEFQVMNRLEKKLLRALAP